MSIFSDPETFKSIPATINPDKPKILYNLVPSTFPFGKNETIIIANKSSPKKVMYKGNSTNVLYLSLVVI